MADDAYFCPRCGARVIPEAQTGLPYADFWRRVQAYLIDMTLLQIIMGVLFVPIFLFSFWPIVEETIRGRGPRPVEVLALLPVIFGLIFLSWIINWFYYALFETSKWQATPGKYWLKMKVTDLEGNPVSFSRASGRFFGRIADSMILIGCLLAAFTAKRQALHDMLAGTLVLRTA